MIIIALTALFIGFSYLSLYICINRLGVLSIIKLNQMKTKVLISGFTVFTILWFTFLVSCDKKSEPTPVTPGTNEVWMESSKFNPAEKTILKGTTITWVNKDSYDHNVTCNGWFVSPNFGKNETYSFKFDSAGVYDYRCTLHLTMTAKIIVQ